MKQFKGIIYQAINIQNSKSYIGKTIQDFEEYKQSHIDSATENRDTKYNKKAKYFYNAIRKYRPENFKWIILGEVFADSKKELKKLLNEAEIESIWLFRTYGSDGVKRDSIYGYNMTPGGDGGDTLSGHPDEKAIRKKQKDAEMKTKSENLNIMHDANVKGWETRRECPDSIKERSKKLRLSRAENKTIMGRNHPDYVSLDYEFLLRNYFNLLSVSTIIKEYNKIFNQNIGRGVYDRFLTIFKLPLNSLGKSASIIRSNFYIDFVKNHKYNIDWYIDNHEILEDNYYYIKHYNEYTYGGE